MKNLKTKMLLAIAVVFWMSLPSCFSSDPYVVEVKDMGDRYLIIVNEIRYSYGPGSGPVEYLFKVNGSLLEQESFKKKEQIGIWLPKVFLKEMDFVEKEGKLFGYMSRISSRGYSGPKVESIEFPLLDTEVKPIIFSISFNGGVIAVEGVAGIVALLKDPETGKIYNDYNTCQILSLPSQSSASGRLLLEYTGYNNSNVYKRLYSQKKKMFFLWDNDSKKWVVADS